MIILSATTENDLKSKMRWLISGRFLFAVLLLVSTVVFQLSNPGSPVSEARTDLYVLIFLLFVLSPVYFVWLKLGVKKTALAYGQIIVDTCFVTWIIFLTGGFSSFFSFLYIMVIIYSSILLYRRGSLVMAALCSLQYAVLMQLEHMGFLDPASGNSAVDIVNFSGIQVFYKISITTMAFFAVALLSSVLSEQARKTKKELRVMEEQIKRVEKMAYLGEMAANLAHEIKNPLASLAGSIQLLREEVVYDPGHDKLMQIVLRETDRLSSLSSNFLLCARPQRGNPEKINLGTALKETVELFEKDHTLKKRIGIETEIASDIWVEMDPLHLRQITLNLLLNASEAIEKKGTIKIASTPVKPNAVEVSIMDNGSGIKKEIIPSIFDPFFTTKPSGTGLGLSIVHSLLDSCNSILEVESEVNRGTIMRFKLKRVDPSIAN